MEYIIALPADPSTADAARGAVISCDPAAVVDAGLATGSIRVATCMGADELRAVLVAAGVALGTDAIAAQPSNCCGGCGG